MAQLVADELSVPLDRVRVQFGDTQSAPYGHGTFASRSAVMGGGAALQSARLVAERLTELASHLMQVAITDLVFRNGRVVVRGDEQRGMGIDELSRISYHEPHLLPDGGQSVLEASTSYDASPGTGTYANAAHLALVEVDPEIGSVKVLRYWVIEDCGTMINPLIVDGQVHGGVAQGLGGALMEEFVYDDDGQLLTTTLKDYRLVGTTDIPRIEVAHLATPSPTTFLGTKGMGEGGAISPGAAVASAVADALSPIGHVFVNELPLTPERVRRFVARAREAGPDPAARGAKVEQQRR
jgi:carbon-monoxide dehydrogenase large subunit